MEYLEIQACEDAHKFKTIFLTQANIISPEQKINNKLPFIKGKGITNKEKAQMIKKLKIPINIIKAEKRSSDKVKRLKEDLHLEKIDRANKEEIIIQQLNDELDTDNQQKLLNDKTKGLKLPERNDKNLTKMKSLPAICISQPIKNIDLVKTSKNVDNLKIDVLNSIVKNKNYKKTFFYNECIKPEKITLVQDQNVNDRNQNKKKTLVNGFKKSLKGKSKKLESQTPMKKTETNGTNLNASIYVNVDNYKKNNMNLNNFYKKIYNIEEHERIRLKNDLIRLNIHEEWKKFGNNYPNHQLNFFTKFLKEKNYIGKTY